MSIQSWKWRNIDTTFQFIIFSGNYCVRSSQNALQWVNCRDWTRFPDPLWRRPSNGQVGSPSNPVLYVNARAPSGHSRRTTELGRVEWSNSSLLYIAARVLGVAILSPEIRVTHFNFVVNFSLESEFSNFLSRYCGQCRNSLFTINIFRCLV
jgi:hypothetical protein